MNRRQLILGAALASLSISPRDRSNRAIPIVIVLTGPQLERRVVLRDVKENEAFVLSLVRGAVHADTVGRRAIDVSMFYARSVVWTNRTADSIPLELADLRSRFYPARGGSPAFLLPRSSISMTQMPPAVVSDAGLQVLARHGIPAGP